ncbi:interleukin-1 receptor-associated kinase 3 isoform 2-T2 [Polymixia lowei]
MDPSTYLYDVPPYLIQTFCKIIDSGDDRFGWRGLAARILPSWSELRRTERLEATGKSPTREILWSWAQQNHTVADLIRVLEDMGHNRALQLFLPGSNGIPVLYESTSASSDELPKLSEPYLSEERLHQEESPSQQALSYGNICVMISGEKERHRITYQDIIEGTRNFHHEMKIAEGKFSDVYRGQTGNETFAVKLFKQVNNGPWKKLWELFRREMEVHHLYQHPNILDLLGCFSDEGSYCLVYPYLSNGSLHHRLHGQGVKYPLSWRERLDIIKGTAKAIHHLHVAQPCPVICGNISSGNILLDGNLHPKISNFGTARLRPHSSNHSCTITLNTSCHSNLGYLPEEYIRDGKLSFSLDVYSFGMVIMETITGRKVIEETPKHTPLRNVLADEVEDSGSVDSCLQFLDQGAGPWPHAVSLRLLRLALECTASRHKSRPSMENVLQVLSQLLPLPSCPPNDEPHTLRAFLHEDRGPDRFAPVEDDEQHSYPSSNPAAPAPDQSEAGPCECSQSEVTFLSGGAEPHVTIEKSGQLSQETAAQRLQAEEEAREEEAREEEAVDLYNSWPVQCSCPAEVDGLVCEDCRANGFSPHQSHTPHSDVSCPSWSIVETPAKERLRNKLDDYHRGLLKTEELLSMAQQLHVGKAEG